MTCAIPGFFRPSTLGFLLLIELSFAASAFDFSGPLQDVQVALNGDTVSYQVSDPARGVMQGSTVSPGVFISQPVNTGGVVAWVAGDTVHYRIYDPLRGLWMGGSSSWGQGVSITGPNNTNGVVAWVAGTTVAYRVYDPAAGVWREGSLPTPGVFVSTPKTAGGVVSWVAGTTVYYRVYDPTRVAWMEGNLATPGVFVSDPACEGGVVAWLAGTTVYFRIYNVDLGAWRGGNSTGTPVVNPPTVSEATAHWVINTQPFTAGYNHNSDAWSGSATPPHAAFTVTSSSGSAPLSVWFTDLSLAGTSWSWNFGDGGTLSGLRTPLHTFTASGRFTVTYTVSGPAGTHATNRTILTDLNPPAGSVTINNGEAYTRSLSVTLRLSATDNSGIVAAMQFSNDGTSWSAWEPYATNRTWTLSSGDGLKTVYARFKDPADNTNSTPASDTITLDTRPLPTVQFANNSPSVSESAGTVTITVVLSAASVFPIAVDYAASDGTATANLDYVPTGGRLSFAPGETTKTFSVTNNNDTLVEQNETILLTLSNPTNAVAGPQATLTILDDDQTTVGFASSAFSVDESANQAVITVSLSAASGLPISVRYATTNGTAASGSDYTSVSGTLTFSPGQISRTFIVPVSNDFDKEPNETVLLQLSNSTNATLGALSSATLTIVDDDLPTVNFGRANFYVNEAAGAASIGVQLNGPYPQTVSVDYSTGNGTASAGSDYVAASGTLSFSPNQTNKTFFVTLFPDGLSETNETVQLTLSGFVNGIPGTNTAALLTIVDDAARPQLTSFGIITNGVFRLTLFGPPGHHYAIEATADLLNWTEVTRLTNNEGIVEFTDPNTRNFGYRFYRAKDTN